MSYAEHGSRIFLTGKLNSNPLLRYGDYVVTRKRSEGRLKLFDSCSDIRAWSPNTLDNCRHFREIVENRAPSGRIVPYDVLIENLIILGQTELASVRRQLERYKSLRLTPEQKKQLREIEYSTEERNETSDDSTLPRETRIVEDESIIPKRPGTPTQSISSSSTNFHDIEIDNDSSADNNSELSQEIFVSSQMYEDSDRTSLITRRDERLAKHSTRTYETDDNQGIIIKKDSEIIALNHELAAKNADLDEMREICRNLESSLTERSQLIDNLRKNFKEQLLDMNEQNEEWKKKLYDAKCSMDHLKINLSEKSQECFLRDREIQELRQHTQEIETLRKDRDSLVKKLDDMKMMLCERNDLLKLNREQAVSLADQEDEINRLLGFIEETQAKYNDQKTRMKSELYDLRSELVAKNSTISQFETHRVTVRTDISPTGSLSKVQTLVVRKLQLALREDLQAVEEELSRRRKIRDNDYFQREDTYSRSKNTRVRTNETKLRENSQQREKDSMDCTIEQLTVQVSASREASVESDAAIDERILEDFENSKETMRQLVVELEPYLEERSSLVGEIKRLREDLEDAQRDSENRDLQMQKQYLSEILNNHRKEYEGYTNKIANLEKLLEEKSRREKDYGMDEEIDEALALHVKRSIERITKLSAGLRGAGDEMAKIRDEVEIREAEISKLRQQVDFHASRGQGDEANNENLKEIVRLKSEKKRLTEDSKNQRETLQITRDKLQSREFELKGLKRHKNDITAQYKRDIQMKITQIEVLTKENEGLNKTVLMINDLVMESDAMKIKLESLQDENSKLIEENTTTLKRCENYENRLLDYADREMRAKESHDRDLFELQERAAKNEILMETLRRENKDFVEVTRANELKIKKLSRDIELLRDNKNDLDAMENVWTEMSKLNEDRQKLEEKVTRLRYNLENHHRTNDKLEDHLRWQIGENEILRDTIKELNENIAKISNEEMNEEATKKLLLTLPNKICERVEKLREQMDNSRSDDVATRQSEINEMREKSLEDDSMIEKLRDEIKLLKNKIDQQDKKIISLESDRADLMEKLENFQTMENTLENKFLPDFENEIMTKEMEIAKLARDVEMKSEELRNLRERVETLTNEKSEISDELKNEKDLRQTQLAELQRKHTARMKVFNDRHNDSIKKLLSQHEEFTKNTGLDTFDSETWLRSLTINEMAELHKRICASNPCEMIGEASKTRALNDKQNQQLQQDEKLHTDKLNIKNGLRNDPANGFPYMYERRKFESARQKPVEKSFNDNTFDMQRKNFFHQCAIKHKYDSH